MPWTQFDRSTIITVEWNASLCHCHGRFHIGNSNTYQTLGPALPPVWWRWVGAGCDTCVLPRTSGAGSGGKWHLYGLCTAGKDKTASREQRNEMFHNRNREFLTKVHMQDFIYIHIMVHSDTHIDVIFFYPSSPLSIIFLLFFNCCEAVFLLLIRSGSTL